MNAADFNALVAEKIRAESQLEQFKPSGAHFYLHTSPNVLVLLKRMFRSSFLGYYLALTHDFFLNVQDSKGRLKLPGYIEQYPVSIAIEELEKQFSQHESIREFDCNMFVPLGETSNPLALKLSLENEQEATQYADKVVQLLKTEGSRFFDAFSPLYTFKVMTSYGRKTLALWEQVPCMLKYLQENEIKLTRADCGSEPVDIIWSLENLMGMGKRSTDEMASFKYVLDELRKLSN